VDCGGSSVLAFANDFTFESWFKCESISSEMILGDGANDDWIRITDVNTIKVNLADSFVGGGDWDFGSRTFTNNAWNHFTLVRSANVLTAYVNAEADSQQYTLAGVFQPEPFYIGLEGSSYFNGQIDELRMYNRALSAAEVSKNYKHGLSKHS